MSRAPFQVLVLPYYFNLGKIEYCIFQRVDDEYWQGIAGGGENKETPEEAALRESREEANIDSSELLKLQTMSYIPTYYFKGSHLWGDDLFVIPEYCYGLKLLNNNIAISNEHMKYKWCSYKEAYSLLNYDSNRTALWELNQRLLNKGPRN